MVVRFLALVALVLTASGCVSAEVRERCPNWSLSCGCYCGPGGTWSGVGPPPRPLPTAAEFAEMYWEKKYPTKVSMVDGRPIHPSTGKPVNCELIAPFEGRVDDFVKPFAELRHPWVWGTFAELGGPWSYVAGVSHGQIRQGIAMSRACQSLLSNTPAPPTATSPGEAPDWCRGANQEWLGVACLTRAKAE